jgi:ElaB/YqjD/DUF883 family membrane-anchored ribosome-binding protein
MSDQGATAQAKDKAQEVAGQAQEKAQEAAGEARDRLRTQIDDRSTMAGEKVSSQASDLRSVSEQLRQQGKEQPAKIADQAADRLEQAGSYLTRSDADRILHDVEDFARSNPWAVMAGGLALGFVASRLLKASSRDRYEYRSATGNIQARPALPRRSGYEQRFTRPSAAGAAGQASEGVGRSGQPVSAPIPPGAPVPPSSGPGVA